MKSAHIEKNQKTRPRVVVDTSELKKSAILLPQATNKKYTIEGSEEDENIINSCVENNIDYLITYDLRTIGKYNADSNAIPEAKKKGIEGFILSHKNPAIMLAGKVIKPIDALYIPYAFPLCPGTT